MSRWSSQMSNNRFVPGQLTSAQVGQARPIAVTVEAVSAVELACLCRYFQRLSARMTLATVACRALAVNLVHVDLPFQQYFTTNVWSNKWSQVSKCILNVDHQRDVHGTMKIGSFLRATRNKADRGLGFFSKAPHNDPAADNDAVLSFGKP